MKTINYQTYFQFIFKNIRRKSIMKYLLAFATLTTVGISFNAVAAEKPQINSVSFPMEISQNNTTPSPKQPRGEGRGRGNGDRLMERLNLTAEQQKQMESIRNKYQPQMTSLREQITVERDKMSTMLKNNDSQNNLRSQHQKISTMQEKMNNLRFESMLETREILTPQQRQQFSENMDGRRGNKERKQK